MINCSDVGSNDFKRHLLCDSMDGDSNDDDVGVDEGISLPTAAEPQLSMVDPSTAARPAPALDFVPIASTDAAPSSTPAVDEFYNAVGKAPHPKAIIPKKESGW